MQDISRTSLIGGTAMLGFAAASVKTAADFDKSMSAVKAATGATAAGMDQLRAAALQAGADTAFSATQAADGITELAKAGVSTRAILGGGLTGALNLAAAGEMSVGDAAELAASSMTKFGLTGADVPHVADLLAAAAGKAQGSVADMGMAMNMGGGVAAQMGL
jgi:TP901 family phage tail tape measure protein